MKQALIILIFVFTALAFRSQTIAINNNSGSNSITCRTQSINMIASCVGFTSAATFTWVSMVSYNTGTNVNITSPGTYTVAVMNGNMMIVQTFTIFMNTSFPISSISSTFLVMNGSTSPTVTMSAISPTDNIQHEVYSPNGSTLTANSTSLNFIPNGIGTFTHCLVRQDNGCSTCKTFTVVQGATSINKLEEENPIKIYYTISGELFITSTKKRDLSMTDLFGRCLLNFTLDENLGYSRSFSNLDPGIYFLISEQDRRKLKVCISFSGGG